MAIRYVDLAGEEDSQTIRIHKLNKRTGEWQAIDVIVVGNGDIKFSYPDSNNPGTTINAFEVSEKGTPV